jgi:dTDP-glucose pyrophosphorylase
MLKQEISMRTMHLNESIIDALKRMDESGYRSLLVIDDNSQFFGILSLGDIQRAILKNIPLSSNIGGILRKNPKVASKDTSFDEVKSMMLNYRMEFLPVIDEYNNVIKSFFWEEVFGVEQKIPVTPFNLPIVIMAGGFGSRLKPLTNVLPKPLLPIGEKTMLEEIFDRFTRYGCNSFYVSVNYKSELIKFYVNSLQLPFSVELFEENKPMGTAGSLSLLKGVLKETFFVSNCDILVEQDYSEILKYHNESKNEITVIAAIKSHSIPYGTIETGDNGQLLSLIEKPEFTFKINSGVYILEPSVLDEIPEDKFFHITHLIEKVISRKGKVGVFPVNEKSWIDIGEWKGYLEKLKIF